MSPSYDTNPLFCSAAVETVALRADVKGSGDGGVLPQVSGLPCAHLLCTSCAHFWSSIHSNLWPQNRNFVRDQPELVLNMIYGKDGDDAMDEPSLSAAKTKRKEQSEKRKRQYQARAPRDDAAVAKALAESRRSSDQSAQSQASGVAKKAMGQVRDGSAAAAPMPHHPKDFGIANRHPAPPPKKAKPSPGRMPQAEGGMAFCVCGNTMSGKERRCVECTMVSVE